MQMRSITRQTKHKQKGMPSGRGTAFEPATTCADASERASVLSAHLCRIRIASDESKMLRLTYRFARKELATGEQSTTSWFANAKARAKFTSMKVVCSGMRECQELVAYLPARTSKVAAPLAM